MIIEESDKESWRSNFEETRIRLDIVLGWFEFKCPLKTHVSKNEFWIFKLK